MRKETLLHGELGGKKDAKHCFDVEKERKGGLFKTRGENRCGSWSQVEGECCRPEGISGQGGRKKIVCPEKKELTEKKRTGYPAPKLKRITFEMVETGGRNEKREKNQGTVLVPIRGKSV